VSDRELVGRSWPTDEFLEKLCDHVGADRSDRDCHGGSDAAEDDDGR
jgi:hypothetical protein